MDLCTLTHEAHRLVWFYKCYWNINNEGHFYRISEKEGSAPFPGEVYWPSWVAQEGGGVFFNIPEDVKEKVVRSA